MCFRFPQLVSEPHGSRSRMLQGCFEVVFMMERRGSMVAYVQKRLNTDSEDDIMKKQQVVFSVLDVQTETIQDVLLLVQTLSIEVSLLKNRVKRIVIKGYADGVHAVDLKAKYTVATEEAWRAQEIVNLNQEHDMLVNESSVMAAKDASITPFLLNMKERRVSSTSRSWTRRDPSSSMNRVDDGEVYFYPRLLLSEKSPTLLQSILEIRCEEFLESLTDVFFVQREPFRAHLSSICMVVDDIGSSRAPVTGQSLT
ncbi:hypothetical protein Tco_1136296 [Tanacetum coccineum]